MTAGGAEGVKIQRRIPLQERLMPDTWLTDDAPGEILWGSCPGRAPEGPMVSQRLFGRPAPPVPFNCALHLLGNRH